MGGPLTHEPPASTEPGPVPGAGPVLSRDFYDRPVLEVAPDLLGRVVVSRTDAGPVAIRLTEVEAYRGADDPGSHAFRGRTARTAVMFGPPGHCYVYFTYGMHFCMNLVCHAEGDAAAVLLRAGEVVHGVDLARLRRTAARNDRDLARGPARLTVALGIDGSWNGADVVAGPSLTVHAGVPGDARTVVTGPRVGVAGAGAATPWRFWVQDDPTVSAYRAATVRRRRGESRS